MSIEINWYSKSNILTQKPLPQAHCVHYSSHNTNLVMNQAACSKKQTTNSLCHNNVEQNIQDVRVVF
jgi:hypothetical protein